MAIPILKSDDTTQLETLFAVTTPGLETLTARELQRLNLLATPADVTAIEPGGVTFHGDNTALYRANLYLRTANRVLLRVGDFYAAAFSELRKKASRLPWSRFLMPGQSVAIRVSCHKSKLYHAQAVAERVAGAIEDALGTPPMLQKITDEDASDPPQLIVVRLLNNHCTFSIDSSGELLHRRGYRHALAKAPLRETLAAALLLESAWPTDVPLIDPFCGSGVIPIEAALLALRRPAGEARRFAFMQWPEFMLEQWTTLLSRELSDATPRKLPPLIAADRDAGAIRMARENAARAGVAEYIEFAQQPISALQAPAGDGWIVSNPPYGLRLSAGKDLRNLYAQFGQVLRTHCPDWHVALLGTDMKLLAQTGLSLTATRTFLHGGLRVQVGQGRVPSV